MRHSTAQQTLVFPSSTLPRPMPRFSPPPLAQTRPRHPLAIFSLSSHYTHIHAHCTFYDSAALGRTPCTAAAFDISRAQGLPLSAGEQGSRPLLALAAVMASCVAAMPCCCLLSLLSLLMLSLLHLPLMWASTLKPSTSPTLPSCTTTTRAAIPRANGRAGRERVAASHSLSPSLHAPLLVDHFVYSQPSKPRSLLLALAPACLCLFGTTPPPLHQRHLHPSAHSIPHITRRDSRSCQQHPFCLLPRQISRHRCLPIPAAMPVSSVPIRQRSPKST